MNIDKFPFKKTFEGDGTSFSAVSDAEEWAKEKGYSVGSMCRNEPRGLMKGDFEIAKWRNLSLTDIAALDGVMTTSGSFREGSVTVHLTKDPEES